MITLTIILAATILCCGIALLFLSFRKKENKQCWDYLQKDELFENLPKRIQKRMDGLSPYSIVDDENRCVEIMAFITVIMVIGTGVLAFMIYGFLI